MNLVITVHFIFVENYMKKRRKNSRALSLGFTVILIVVISVKRVSIRCQDDIFSRIELITSIVLSSEKANYKNDIQ